MIFFSKNIKKVLSILFAKKKFSPPSQKKYVILDEKGSKIFEKYLNYQEVEILDTRFKTINLFILFKIIFKFKFSLKDYIVEYINRTNCKFIITFFDNDVFYYQLKNYFPDKTIIIIQNGMRPELFFNHLSKVKKPRVDYFLSFSDFYSKKFKEHVKGKFIVIGSFRNNLEPKKKNNFENKSIAYLSSGPEYSKNTTIFEKVNLEGDLYFSPEKKLLPIIKDYCKKNNFKLRIIARSKSKKTFEFEKKFYDKILPTDNFEFLDTFGGYEKCYKLSDNSNLTICIYSAFGLESVARGNRTAIFNVRDKVAKMESLKLFWSDKQFPLKGPFWSDEISEKEVNRVLDYCLKSSDDEWQKSAESIMPSLIFFDNDNSSFKKLINN